MDFSIKQLIVTKDKEWTRDLLWSYGQVEKITIIGDWLYHDDDCSNFCLYLQNLKEFEVVDSNGIFFTEGGALYANIKRGDIVNEDSRFCYLCGNVEGKMLVAVPTAYPGKHFKIAEGTTCVCPGVFEGLKQIESIYFPESIEYLDFHCLDDMPNLKTLYIPNKKVKIMDHDTVSCKKPALECIDKHQTLSDEVKKSWWLWWEWKLPIDRAIIKSFDMNRKPVFPSNEMENAIRKAVTDRDAFFAYYRECTCGKPNRGQLSLFPVEEHSDIKLPLLLMLVEPRILHPETKEDAVDIINLLYGDAKKAMEVNAVEDEWGEFARMDFDNPDVFQQIKEKINSQWDAYGVESPWEDDDLLNSLRDCKEKCLMSEAAVSDPVAYVNNLDYRTILTMLRDKAESSFLHNAEEDIYSLLNYLYMQKEYRNLNSSFPYNDIKYLKLAADQGDLISLWELSKIYDDESSKNKPELSGNAYLCWKRILSCSGIGMSKDDIQEIKSWAEQCIKQSSHGE
jgi:hypothetical protein